MTSSVKQKPVDNGDPPVRGDEYLSLQEAARLCPPAGDVRSAAAERHAASLWRWCRRGVVTRDGRRVRLRHRVIANRYVTTASAVAEFLREVKVR